MRQKIQTEIDALQKLRIALMNVRTAILENEQAFNSKVQGLRAKGLPAEIADPFEKGYWPQNGTYITKVISSIDNEGLPYINKNIQVLQKALASARM